MMPKTRLRAAYLAGLIGIAVFAVAIPLVVRAQQTDRAKRIGGRLMCMCGCGQVLTQCNHINCPMSVPMMKELDQRIGSGDSDDLILQAFVQEYGEAVLAEPPAKGFNRLAWYLPGVAFALGLGIVALVIGKWRHRMLSRPATPSVTVSPELLERARREADKETEDL
ncbi:MAG: cytochrome c-type biogenesis protein CcmH [Candidatus Acidiferrales bacterium]